MARRVTFKGRLLSDGATKQTTMWRCGVQHSTEGADFEDDAFTDAEWERLEADPMLVVSEGGASVDADPVEAEALHDRIVTAFAALTPSDFTAGGRPKVGAMRKRLPEDADALSADVVDAAWERYATAVQDALVARVSMALSAMDQQQMTDASAEKLLETVQVILPEDAGEIDADTLESALVALRSAGSEA